MTKIRKTRGIDPTAGSNRTGYLTNPTVTTPNTDSLHTTTDLDRGVQRSDDVSPSQNLNFSKFPDYAALLSYLRYKGGTDDSALIQLLSRIGFPSDMSAAQQADWDKQLLDQILSQLSEEDARKYNLGVLQEQRLYDSPTNQLARLMGAGISRDAAIQLLSASGSGGSSVAAGSAAAQAAGIPASQSELNDIQGKTAIAGAVFQGIGTLSSLMSLGFSAPAALAPMLGLAPAPKPLVIFSPITSCVGAKEFLRA